LQGIIFLFIVIVEAIVDILRVAIFSKNEKKRNY